VFSFRLPVEKPFFSENTFSEITESELLVRQQNNDMELLRIELESKKLQIETLKHDFQVKIDERAT
jgi:hypothetical protein